MNTAGDPDGAAAGGEDAVGVLAVGSAVLLTGVGVLSATGVSVSSGTVRPKCFSGGGKLLMLALFLLSLLPAGVSKMYDLGSRHFSRITASSHLLEGCC